MYYTYILQSLVDESFYIGSTDNVKKRRDRHNKGYEKTTKSKRPYRLAWYTEKKSRKEALMLEKNYFIHPLGIFREFFLSR